jgi:hypothetical protein
MPTLHHSQRVFVMFDAVVKPYGSPIYSLRHTEDVISIREFI